MDRRSLHRHSASSDRRRRRARSAPRAAPARADSARPARSPERVVARAAAHAPAHRTRSGRVGSSTNVRSTRRGLSPFHTPKPTTPRKLSDELDLAHFLAQASRSSSAEYTPGSAREVPSSSTMTGSPRPFGHGCDDDIVQVPVDRHVAGSIATDPVVGVQRVRIDRRIAVQPARNRRQVVAGLDVVGAHRAWQDRRERIERRALRATADTTKSSSARGWTGVCNSLPSSHACTTSCAPRLRTVPIRSRTKLRYAPRQLVV